MAEPIPTPNRRLPRNQERRPASEDLMRGLSSPVRRAILRKLHRAGEARSSSELSKELSRPFNSTNYHVKILRDCELIGLTDTRRKRGATESFYASRVLRDQVVRDILSGVELHEAIGFDTAD
jgi:DNA-binding transcriptional ArsR family regulator